MRFGEVEVLMGVGVGGVSRSRTEERVLAEEIQGRALDCFGKLRSLTALKIITDHTTCATYS